MSETHFIDAEIHTTGRSHRSGYCSDPADFFDVDEFTNCKFEIPSKQFIKDHCNSDGEITWSGMEELSKYDRLCNGSGYCGCSIYRKVTKATLKKRRNIKNEFLQDESSDDEVDSVTPAPFQAPMPIVNSFRGRINSTYTSNSNWYSSKNKFDNPEYQSRVNKIPCNRGANCHRKSHPTKPCHYNHNF